MKELWVPVYHKEFAGLYEVSNKGRVFSNRRHKFMTPSPNNVGALQVHLTRDGKTKPFLINRLVYLSFNKVKDDQNYFVRKDILNPYHNELNNLYLYRVKRKKK